MYPIRPRHVGPQNSHGYKLHVLNINHSSKALIFFKNKQTKI